MYRWARFPEEATTSTAGPATGPGVEAGSRRIGAGNRWRRSFSSPDPRRSSATMCRPIPADSTAAVVPTTVIVLGSRGDDQHRR